MKYLGIVCCIAILSIAGCSPDNVTVDDSLKKYFDDNKVTGTFALLDNGQEHFTIYNLSRYKDSAYLPGSSFRIISSLIGINIGRISNENMVIKRDSIAHALPNGDTATARNKDLSLEGAFKVDDIAYFREVANRIGKDTMQRWLDTLGYASKNGRAVIKNADNFMFDNSIKVTTDEQLGISKKLYFKQLPFQGRPQDIVKKMMQHEGNANYKLTYVTGSGIATNGHVIGWVIGWIEENEHPYFFVLNTEADHNTDLTTTDMNITRSCLKQLGFFEGRK